MTRSEIVNDNGREGLSPGGSALCAASLLYQSVALVPKSAPCLLFPAGNVGESRGVSAPVHDLDLAERADHDIRGLEVAVADASRVGAP
jgi:hypothetical protein